MVNKDESGNERVSASRQLNVNNLPRVVTQPRPGRGSNSRPPDRKSDALPLRHHATQKGLKRGRLLKSVSHFDNTAAARRAPSRRAEN